MANAKSPKRIPAWDLFSVLESLREPSFEPLVQCDFQSLSWKTVFLVALASGRRGSEIHALSGLPQDIAWESDGSISLRFLPDFLAKNQLPGDPSPVISIKPLSGFISRSDPDRALCPVRALRRYLRFAKAIRGPLQRRLFISINPSYKKDIAKSTIARWICALVKASYAKSHDSNLPQSLCRAHEIRAWSASLAIAHSARLIDILDAAFWRSEVPFIRHYLRDVSRLREDGSRGIASISVCQQRLSTRGKL